LDTKQEEINAKINAETNAEINAKAALANKQRYEVTRSKNKIDRFNDDDDDHDGDDDDLYDCSAAYGSNLVKDVSIATHLRGIDNMMVTSS
jgi:hypothetical protein